MSTYWVLTNEKISSERKTILRLLGLDANPRFRRDTRVGELTEKQAKRLADEGWIRWVEKDAGTLQSLTDEDEEMRKERKLFVQTLKTHGTAVEPNSDPDSPAPAGATHAIIGYEADGTPVVVRRRFAAV